MLANQKMLPLFLLDAIFISFAIGFAYFLRLGGSSFYFDNWVLVNFTLRVAIPVVMIVLFPFRLYQPIVLSTSGRELARQMIVPIVLSGIFLSGTAYWAFQNGSITTFPRSVLLICFVTLFAFVWLSRVLFSRWTNGFTETVKTIEY
jgi:FlaA1/EpsC-like NDP-sugar epimerase